MTAYTFKFERDDVLDDLVKAWLKDTLEMQRHEMQTMGRRHKWTLGEMQQCFETFEACNVLLDYLSIPGEDIPAKIP